MSQDSLTLTFLPDRYAVCRLRGDDPVPDWAYPRGLVSITRRQEERSVVWRRDGGPDELTTRAPTQVGGVAGTKLRHFQGSTEDAGRARAALADVQVSGVDAHRSAFGAALGEGASAAKDIVMMNAAAALVVVGPAAVLRAGVATPLGGIAGGSAPRTAAARATPGPTPA